MQTLATDPVVADTITITHVSAAPQTIEVAAGGEVRWDHDDTDHHLVVLKGTCRVLGRPLQAGGSAFVPAGLDHSVKAGAWGCTFFFLESTDRKVAGKIDGRG